MKWIARQYSFEFPRQMLVMGIINVTPDSFSDGGRFLDPERAVSHGLELVKQGADILDIGGESTRPGASPVDEAEELSRVLPVIRALAAQTRVPLSIDTMKAAVAEAALEAGAAIVNDVGACNENQAMWSAVAKSGAGYVCMHMKGTPRTMQVEPRYKDVVSEVDAFFRERLNRLGDCGIGIPQIILDPGIGFGKTLEHNLELIAAMQRFAGLGRPLMLGVSRKSFITRLLKSAPGETLAGSLACACMAATQSVGVIRVHDVRETVQAVRMTEAILSRKNS